MRAWIPERQKCGVSGGEGCIKRTAEKAHKTFRGIPTNGRNLATTAKKRGRIVGETTREKNSGEVGRLGRGERNRKSCPVKRAHKKEN